MDSAEQGTSVAGIAPEELLLDGQQRMTSLYKTAWNQQPARVRTPKGKVVERYFYIDVMSALDPHADFEEAIDVLP